MGSDDRLIVLPKQINAESLIAAQELLSKILQGEIIGFSYAAICTNQEFEYGAVGAARERPELSLGLISRLKFLLNQYIDGSEI